MKSEVVLQWSEEGEVTWCNVQAGWWMFP